MIEKDPKVKDFFVEEVFLNRVTDKKYPKLGSSFY
jgi:hypothetical protein